MEYLLLFLLFAASATSDLAVRLSRWKPVEMPFDASALDARQRREVEKLVDAARQMELIYWQQSDPTALDMYRSTKDPLLRRMLMINGCRWDLIDENKPLASYKLIQPGRNLYPQGLTRQQIEAYVKEHPEERDAIYNPYTILRCNGKKLDAAPYHFEYKSYLQPAAKLLQEAADLSDDSDFSNFLRLRAKALLTVDYYPRDLACLDPPKPRI